MQIRVSSNGQVVVPGAILEQLGIRPGEFVDVIVKPSDAPGNHVSTSPTKASIITDPRTGLPTLTLGSNAPRITNEMVAEILTDFP